MVNRPKDWDEMNQDQRYAWLRQQRHQPRKGIGGPRKKLTEKDQEKVWGLLRVYDNKTMVAQMLGVGRRTLHRYLEDHPMPEKFEVAQNALDYPEIQAWLKRQRGFASEGVVSGYIGYIQGFHNYMKEKHPERQRPMLWTSDDILEYVQTFKPYQQHNVITPLRQLAKKAQKEFPMIDLGLLPTKRTHQAKRSLAGKEEYYLDIVQVVKMIKAIEEVLEWTPIEKARNQAIIALLFNIACRTGDPHAGKGLVGILIENLDLKNHHLRMQDKGDIWWNVLGLSDDTIKFIQDYLELRGNPTSGFLFVNHNNGKDTPMQGTDVNNVIRTAGKKAGIKGKMLLAKSFRKSLAKYALEVLEMNPMALVGTGKQTKTCFCVGWSDFKVLLEHYAPKMAKAIENGRRTFTFKENAKDLVKKQKMEDLKEKLTKRGVNFDENQLGILVAVLEEIF